MPENESIDLRCSSLLNALRICAFCSWLSQFTCSKLSGSLHQTRMPSRVTGSPSMRNIHCQPRMPR
ncbi:hypothetical protein D3C76_1386530 [compost metagenome]